VSLWGRVFAAGYDRFLAPTEAAGLGAERDRVLADARGRVIEIGAGTGVNLSHYTPAVSELVVCEPEAPMAERLKKKVKKKKKNGLASVRVVAASAERLPFPDASFDCAVSTLVLCTVDDPTRAIHELGRVLRPQGRLLFIEHVRAPAGTRLARWQDRLAPLWLRFGHGCRCNRSTLEAIAAGPFDVEQSTRGELPRAAPLVRPYITGRAVAR